MKTYLLKESYNGEARTVWTETKKREIEKIFKIYREGAKKINGLVADGIGYYKSVSPSGSVTEVWIELCVNNK